MLYKNVVFEKIRLQNFLSYGSTPVEVVFRNGITFITGYNKDDDDTNGVGKTSLIVESLSFLIFGDSYKGLSRNLIKNSYTTGPCIVEGWLTVNDDKIYIARTIGPNKLVLEVNGDSTKYTKTIPETTKDIIKILGISKSTFTNTIVMTNKDSLSFLNQSKSEKVKFIEDVLGLSAFSEFYKKSKDLLREEDKKHDSIKYKFDFVGNTLKRDEKSSSDFEINKSLRIQELQENIQRLETSDWKDYSPQIAELKNDLEPLKQLINDKKSSLQEAQKTQQGFIYTINEYTSKLKELENNSVCPTCKRAYDTHSIEEVNKIKVDTTTKLEAVRAKAAKLKSAIDKCQSVVQENIQKENSILREIKNLEAQQAANSGVSAKIIKLKAELDACAEQKNTYISRIEENNKELSALKVEMDASAQSAKILSAVKDIASPDGVKAILIKRIIDILNERINYYLLKLASPFKVVFDQYFEEKIIHKNGTEYTYNSLSGGEAKRVDFAMLFAFRDMRKFQSNVNINITVMDELFDSALSEKGMASIIDLLKDMKESCFYIVTHRPRNVDETGCSVINLVKENGITSIVDN